MSFKQSLHDVSIPLVWHWRLRCLWTEELVLSTCSLPAVFLDTIRATVFCLAIDFVFSRICASIFCLTTSCVSARSSPASYSSQARSRVWLNTIFPRSFVYYAMSLACLLTELFSIWSLFSIFLLPSLHNIVYTPFLYFSFLRTGFCNLPIFSLPNKFPSLPLRFY